MLARSLKVGKFASGRPLKVGKFASGRPLSQISISFGGLQLIGGLPLDRSGASECVHVAVLRLNTFWRSAA